jgi:mRNA interferase MazF
MSSSVPERGEIWWVDFDPAVGSEFRKVRPAAVLSAKRFDALRVRIIVPLTSWSARFEHQSNKVRIPATPQNGLSGESAADVLHVRVASTERFASRLGMLEPEIVAQLAAGVAAAIDFQR